MNIQLTTMYYTTVSVTSVVEELELAELTKGMSSQDGVAVSTTDFKSPASGKENVQFPDSPDNENLPDFRTGRDIRQSPNAGTPQIWL